MLWEFEGSANPCKALLLEVVASTGGPLDDVALDPVKEVPPIHLDLDFRVERDRAYLLLVADVFATQL